MHVNTEDQLRDTIETLVLASQAGNRTAFEQLMQLTQARAMRVAAGILHDSNETAEALQQGYVYAFFNIRKLREPKYFETWLLRIVTNEAIARRRILAKKLKMAIIDKVQEPCKAASPVENVIQNELDKAIRNAMLKLSKKEAVALALFGLEDMPQSEVAQAMNCSVESVRGYVFQARQKMKKLLKEYL